MSAPSHEEQIIRFWNAKKIYEKVRKASEKNKRFFFLDGPPYATGAIHMGTALNKVLKDTYIRFFRMNGFNVHDQPGYDTHGLPIENKVEKKLGFTKKSDIEKLGIESFTKECKTFATEFIDVMNSEFANLGVWMDWKNPYLTLNSEYIQGAWFTFKTAFEKGLLYKGKYPVHLCPHCETAVAYNEIEYHEVQDPAVFVKFALREDPNTFLVIWTTTPWTLPSNMGIMVHPNFDYAYVEVEHEGKKQTLIIAEKLVYSVMEKAKIKKFHVKKIVKGKELVGLHYNSPLRDLIQFKEDLKNAYKVVPSEQFVTLDAGTGLVHTAPGHGSEDFKVGQEQGLPALCPVNLDGTYTNEVKKWAGMFVKSADPEITSELSRRGALLSEGKIKHDYPMCWRCKTNLLLVAVPQWFFRVTSIRKKLLEENEKTNWQPDWVSKRFENWLMSLGDWPVSRQRYWGIPLPIWECTKCHEVKVVGSVAELGAEGKKLKDLHKPHIDKIVLKCKCKGEMHRVPDVLDVWFDSGVSAWASVGHPANAKPFKDLWPVDLVIEGPDQIRGWWNSSLICSVLTFDRRAFEKIIYHGFVLDSHGVKMSKSIGNVISPQEVVEKYGRDVLRYYLLNSAPWDDFYFKWDDVEEVSKIFNNLHNTLRFYETYGEKVAKKPKLNVEDEWILAKLAKVSLEMKKEFESLNAHKGVSMIGDFMLNDISRWYIKLIRDRTRPGYKGKDRDAAFWTLREILMGVAQLLGPIAPFTAEHIFQTLRSPKDEESVHMLQWMSPKGLDEKLVANMEVVKKATEAINAARNDSGVNLRWPLKGATVVGNDKTAESVKALHEIIQRMGNLHHVHVSIEEEDYSVRLNYKNVGPKYGKDIKKIEGLLASANKKKLKKEIDSKNETKLGDFILTKTDLEFRVVAKEGTHFDGGRILLDLSEDEELAHERLYRELVRAVQEERKNAKLEVENRIELSLDAEGKFKRFLESNKEALMTEVGAKNIKFGKGEKQIEYKDRRVSFSFKKA